MTPGPGFPSPPASFCRLSRLIGNDPLLVQGPGGNTSVKFGNVMWIKASGTQLSDAEIASIFTPVDVEYSVAEIDAVEDSPGRDTRLNPGDGHRPSIETSFHAMLPWKYVFHYHSVHALAHLTSEEGVARALGRLSGFNPALVPYRKPGVPLSRSIRTAIAGRDSSVILLRNHGMIVCGNSVAEVRRRMFETERCLQIEQRTDHEPPDRPAEIPGWEWLPGSGLLMNDTLLQERLVSGSYFPDQVVFLGARIPDVTAGQLQEQTGPVSPAVLVRGAGLYLRSEVPVATREMLECLWQVLTRVPASWQLQRLNEQEVGELANWDAEKYRRALSEGHRH